MKTTETNGGADRDRPTQTSGDKPRRLRRPSWTDPRLGIGILLIAGAVALGSWAVDSARTTVAVWAADRALAPGLPIAASDLTAIDVSLGSTADNYLLADNGVPDGVTVSRTVSEGDLVPASVLVDTSSVDARPIVVPVAASSSSLQGGDIVDVWMAPAPSSAGNEQHQPPTLLVADATIAAVLTEDSVFAASDRVQAELLVSSSAIPDLLQAATDGATLTLVPTAPHS